MCVCVCVCVCSIDFLTNIKFQQHLLKIYFYICRFLSSTSSSSLLKQIFILLFGRENINQVIGGEKERVARVDKRERERERERVCWNRTVFHWMKKTKSFTTISQICGTNTQNSKQTKKTEAFYLHLSLSLYLSIYLSTSLSLSISPHPPLSLSLYIYIYICSYLSPIFQALFAVPSFSTALTHFVFLYFYVSFSLSFLTLSIFSSLSISRILPTPTTLSLESDIQVQIYISNLFSNAVLSMSSRLFRLYPLQRGKTPLLKSVPTYDTQIYIQ